MFLSFFQWRDPEHIARLAVPVCMARVRTDEALSAQLLAQQAAMEAAFGVRPIVLQNDCLEISSTEARRLLFFGIADEVLHPDVRSMIERENLYGVGGKYHALPFDELRRVSLSLHKEKRRAHAQGVSDTAVLLARKYGADETDAARAGILHDITKALSPAQQQKLVDHWKLPVSPFEYTQTKLLHAKTGAAAAERIFGEDAAVVSAIDYHTTGRANMTLLEKIIYIADYMEPNRDFPGVDRLRETVRRDLDEGVLLGINMTLEQLAQKGQPPCIRFPCSTRLASEYPKGTLNETIWKSPPRGACEEDLPSARSAHGADHYSGDTSAFRQCVCGVEAACKASGAAGDLCAGTGASCR